MIGNPEALIQEFAQAAALEGLSPAHIEHERQAAPHAPHSLPHGKCAVYVFSLSREYGEQCPAGPHRVLKVGKAGPQSNARFQSQHYNPASSGSNLARVLIESRILWPYLGVLDLSQGDVAAWIRSNTDRDNFYMDAAEIGTPDVLARCLGALERFIRGRFGPVFEGG